MAVIVVQIRTDGGGSARVICTGLSADPMFPDKVVLEGIQALTMPLMGYYMTPSHWSIARELVLNYMIGEITSDFPITPDILEGEAVPTAPNLPGTTPTSDLVNRQVTHLIQKPPPPSRTAHSEAVAGSVPIPAVP